MSEPELAYMTGANDDFDLPRWQTQAHHDPLSSSAQAAQSATQSSYLYPGAPPPPPPPPPTLIPGQRLPPTHQSSSSGSSRQPRISQLLEQDQQLGSNPSSYLSTTQSQLARSASFGGNAAGNSSSSSRSRRHHQPDDLEGAFNSDSQASRQPPSSNSFYPSSVGYHTQQLTSTSSTANSASLPATDQYSDMYYTGSGANHAPKRSQTLLDASTRTARSPLRTGNTTSNMIDPYSQQAQYSPTTTSSYPYSASSDQRNQPSAVYQSHSRTHSIVKTEAMTPPVPSPYSPHSGMHSPSVFPSPYAMDTSSPHPGSQSQSHLTAHPPARQTSTSTPSTPLSYTHSSQNTNYFPQDQQMVVEPPQKRRASGLRRIRDARDLRPRLDNQPVGRRMDSTGVYLSVSLPAIVSAFPLTVWL
jgi:dual specificity protein kinase YAK1